MITKYKRLAVLAGLTMVATPIVINAVGIDRAPAPPVQHFTDAEPGPVTPHKSTPVSPAPIVQHITIVKRYVTVVSPAKSPSPEPTKAPAPKPTKTPKPKVVAVPGPKCDSSWPGAYEQGTQDGNVVSWKCVYPPKPAPASPPVE